MFNPWTLSIIIILLIFMILTISYYGNLSLIPKSYPHVKFEDTTFKTGDILWFRSFTQTNINDFLYDIITTGSTGFIWAHVGVVVVIGGIPYVYESLGGTTLPKYDAIQNKYRTGNILTPLETRLADLKGIILHVPLLAPAKHKSDEELLEFTKNTNHLEWKVDFKYMLNTIFKTGSCAPRYTDTCPENVARFLRFLELTKDEECIHHMGLIDIYSITKSNMYGNPSILINNFIKYNIS